MIDEQIVAGADVRVLADGTLEVRDDTVILRDGMRDPSFPAKYHRYVLHPGDDLAGKPERVVSVANAVWTEDVMAAWQAAQSASNE